MLVERHGEILFFFFSVSSSSRKASDFLSLIDHQQFSRGARTRTCYLKAFLNLFLMCEMSNDNRLRSTHVPLWFSLWVSLLTGFFFVRRHERRLFAGCLFTIYRLAVGELTGWCLSPAQRHSGIRPGECVMVWNKMPHTCPQSVVWRKLWLTDPSEQ